MSQGANPRIASAEIPSRGARRLAIQKADKKPSAVKIPYQ
jgi:hypothetical protein